MTVLAPLAKGRFEEFQQLFEERNLPGKERSGTGVG
jgi:hypothetical protein